MYSAQKCIALKGLEPCMVQVEADVSEGLPMFEMIGYLSSEVREARERVRTALRNTGIFLPPKRITVNLAPADMRKEGSGFDLAIGLAILTAIGKVSDGVLRDVVVIGEMGLDGQINPVRGILNMVSKAKEEGYTRCIVPKKNEKEGNLVPDMEIMGVESLKQLLDFLEKRKGERNLFSFWEKEKEGVSSINIGAQKEDGYEVDFSDIRGQESGKRAALIGAAGLHNLLYIGPPGSGKTMMASRIPTILPDLTREESLEITKIYSITGLLDGESPLVTKRPFRSPHHTCTAKTLAGGGPVPRPGEISLANYGVLFLDELPEFSRSTLEILRQPMEEGKIQLTRTTGTYVYPANFMMVGAMNPCRCGFYPDRNKCNCSYHQIQQYLGKISQPLLDRIDLCVELPKVEYDHLQNIESGISSKEMKMRAERAIKMQRNRYKDTKFRFNSELTPAGVKEFCIMEKDGEGHLKRAYENLDLSVRGYHKILKTARTIADLDEAEKIGKKHILEAVFYRSLDKKYWMG